MDGLIIVSLLFYVGVLISFRSTVKEHPYIAFATAGYIATWFLPVGGMALVGLIFLAALGSAIWATYDTHKLQMHKYRLNGLTRPLMAALGFILLWILGAWPFWIVFFTWHLVNRNMILDGVARVKTKYKKSPPSHAKRSFVPDQQPDQTSDIPSPQSSTQDSGKVRVMDVVVEDVEVGEADDDESAYSPEPEQQSPPSGAGRRSSASRKAQRDWRKMAKWGAIGIVGIVVIFAAVPLIAPSTSISSSSGNYGGNYRGQQQYAYEGVSVDATYQFWQEASGIISVWWELTSRVTNQSGSPDTKFFANMLMLEASVDSLNQLSTQNVDAQAVQTILNIRNCMSRYLQVGYDADACLQRYGNNMPQSEAARLFTALAFCGAETLTVKEEYGQTARQLSRTYGRRFSGS